MSSFKGCEHLVQSKQGALPKRASLQKLLIHSADVVAVGLVPQIPGHKVSPSAQQHRGGGSREPPAPATSPAALGSRCWSCRGWGRAPGQGPGCKAGSHHSCSTLLIYLFYQPPSPHTSVIKVALRGKKKSELSPAPLWRGETKSPWVGEEIANTSRCLQSPAVPPLPAAGCSLGVPRMGSPLWGLLEARAQRAPRGDVSSLSSASSLSFPRLQFGAASQLVFTGPDLVWPSHLSLDGRHPLALARAGGPSPCARTRAQASRGTDGHPARDPGAGGRGLGAVELCEVLGLWGCGGCTDCCTEGCTEGCSSSPWPLDVTCSSSCGRLHVQRDGARPSALSQGAPAPAPVGC